MLCCVCAWANLAKSFETALRARAPAPEHRFTFSLSPSLSIIYYSILLFVWLSKYLCLWRRFLHGLLYIALDNIYEKERDRDKPSNQDDISLYISKNVYRKCCSNSDSSCSIARFLYAFRCPRHFECEGANNFPLSSDRSLSDSRNVFEDE